MKIVNKTGYLKGAKTAKNPVNIIPSNIITTNNMAFPIKANGKTLYPNTGQYKFPTSPVVETPLKQDGVESAKTNPISTPSLGPNFFNPKANPRNNNLAYKLLEPAINAELDKKAENSPNVKFAKQKERDEAYRNYVKKNPLKGKATGQVDMTMSPIDVAIAAEAGLVGATVRGGAGLLGRIMGASIPGTGGALTVGQGLNAYGAYDAIANRAPAVFKDIKNKNYGSAVGEAALGGLGLYGLKGTRLNKTSSLGKTNKVKSASSVAAKETNSVGPNGALLPQEAANAQISANYIAKRGNEIINEINTPEGMRRLRNQFKRADPNLSDEQLDHLVGKRLSEMNTAVKKNQPDYLLKFGQGAPGTSTEGLVEDFYPTQNAHWASFNPHPEVKEVNAPASLFPPKPQPQTMSAINLQKTHGYDVFTDPNYKPGSVSLGRGLEENPMVLDHEIGGHGLQAGGEIPIDEDLRRLLPRNTSYRRDPNTGTVTTTDNRSWLERKLNPLDEQALRDKEYFDRSGGRTHNNEAFPFLVEQRRKMIERGILNSRYDKVTPWKLFKAKLAAGKNTGRNFIEGDRLINFTPFWKYGKLANIMNQAPAVLPGAVGVGALGAAGAAASSSEEQKYGNKNIKPILKYKNGSKSVSLAFSRGEKDPKGGLTQKGVDKYNRATGGNLKMAVTTPPSKLKPGSKAANRRKSFCARMSGVKGPMNKNGKPTRKALALRKWNC